MGSDAEDKELNMEKYGVETEEDKNLKISSEGITCPECGTWVTRHGATLKCENCGTKPFEKKEDNNVKEEKTTEESNKS